MHTSTGACVCQRVCVSVSVCVSACVWAFRENRSVFNLPFDDSDSQHEDGKHRVKERTEEGRKTQDKFLMIRETVENLPGEESEREKLFSRRPTSVSQPNVVEHFCEVSS